VQPLGEELVHELLVDLELAVVRPAVVVPQLGKLIEEALVGVAGRGRRRGREP